MKSLFMVKVMYSFELVNTYFIFKELNLTYYLLKLVYLYVKYVIKEMLIFLFILIVIMINVMDMKYVIIIKIPN